MKVALEKYKNHFEITAWFKCVIVAFGLIVVAYFIELSNSLLFASSESAWVKGVYYVGLTFIIGSIIWLALYISPKLLQSIISTPAAQTKPAQTQQTPPQETAAPIMQAPVPPKTEPTSPNVQVRWVPVRPETQAVPEEESDSEKLRREFRNRSF
jgi:hypothetical protein